MLSRCRLSTLYTRLLCEILTKLSVPQNYLSSYHTLVMVLCWSRPSPNTSYIKRGVSLLFCLQKRGAVLSLQPTQRGPEPVGAEPPERGIHTLVLPQATGRQKAPQCVHDLHERDEAECHRRVLTQRVCGYQPDSGPKGKWYFSLPMSDEDCSSSCGNLNTRYILLRMKLHIQGRGCFQHIIIIINST